MVLCPIPVSQSQPSQMGEKFFYRSYLFHSINCSQTLPLLFLLEEMKVQIVLVLCLMGALSQVMPFRRPKCDKCFDRWVYLDPPVSVGVFDYSTLSEVPFSFSSAISSNIRSYKCQVILFLRTGNKQATTFRTRVRVNDGKVNGKDLEYKHWTYGYRYPQEAISYNSETIEIPCKNTRHLYVQTTHVEQGGSHNMQLFVSGYTLA